MDNIQSLLDKLSFKLTDKDGWFEDEDGISYQIPIDSILTGRLNFCGCGDPDAVAEYIADGLQFIKDEYYNITGRILEDRIRQVFGNEKSAQFFFQWCDSQKLTEHGSSVPGWLSKKGINMISDLSVLRELTDLVGK